MVNKTVTHVSTLRVRYGETDKMGVVYHSNYFRYFEVGRSSYFRDLGYTYKQFEEDGFMLPLINCACDFIMPAAYDDELFIHTSISHFKGARITLEYRIYKDGQSPDQEQILLVKGHTSHAFVDMNMKPVNVKKANVKFYELLMAQDKG